MMRTVLLGGVCAYVTEKVPINDVSMEDYVSTENLIADKGGLSLASKLPGNGKVTRYRENDVLVSNIRPYFKKIWHANRDGGASNDVLVFRPTIDSLFHGYLHYILKDDKFFDFSTASSSGSKMPRGDKTQIMKYPVFLPELEDQKKIAEILGKLDEKIELNRRMNETLEKIGQTLFKHYFITNLEAESWEHTTIEELSDSVLRGFTAKYVDQSELINLNQKVNKGNHLDKQYFKYYEPSVQVPQDKYAQKGDILINSLGQGTLGRVHHYLESTSNVIVDQHITIVRSSLHNYLYFRLANHDNHRLQSMVSGTTGMLMLNVSKIREFKVPQPPESLCKSFDEVIDPINSLIVKNNREIDTLTRIRDSLLPGLISGKIEV